MRANLVPVVPLSPERMLALSTHVVVARVVAVERGPAIASQGMTVAEVRVALRIESARKGSARAGDHLDAWGTTIVAGNGAPGVADTVPGTLAVGARVEAYLAKADAQLVLPFWLAMRRLPVDAGPA